MSNHRRLLIVLACIGVVAGVAFWLAPVAAQPKPEPRAGDTAPSVAFSIDNKTRRMLEAAEDFIKEESWDSATQILQKIFDRADDVFIEVARKGPDGKDTKVVINARTEAHRLLGMMPAKGRVFYQVKYGPTAADRMKEARNRKDPELLEDIARRYLHTEAAAEALQLLASYHFDHGHPVLAAQLADIAVPPGKKFDEFHLAQSAPAFERLLQHPAGAAHLTSQVLFKAVVAFRHVGDKANAENAWKLFAEKLGKETLRLGDQKLNLEQLQKQLDKIVPLEPATVPEWPVFRGNAQRSAQGIGGTPFLELIWKQETIRSGETRRAVMDQAVKMREARGEAILPAFFPIVVKVVTEKDKPPRSLLIFRSHWGVHAADLERSGKLYWEAPSSWSMDRMVMSSSKTGAITRWINDYFQMGRHSALYENSTLGTLSSDNTRVYAVEDLALAPVDVPVVGIQERQEIFQAVHHNRLQAFSAADGKYMWEAGGLPRPAPALAFWAGLFAEVKEPAGDIELKGSFFLGPPLPLGGKLYVLNEKNQVIRLICLEPKGGNPLWSLKLAATRDKLIGDPFRRMQATPVAYGQGILVCPTNAGMIVGVDLLNRSLAWAHSYDSAKIETLGWNASAPVIRDGKVIFTAPDGKTIHCLNVRDGSLVWKNAKTDKDLYLAGVFKDRVLIVGKDSCRALSLAEGKQLWQLETGLPSGFGVAADNIYYLPLKYAARTKEPEVCAIDVEKGVTAAHTRSRQKEVPGNLLFHEGEVISQTADVICAYPQLRVKLTQIDDLLARNPKDPTGLTERGELRLDAGNLIGAVEDLREALANKPPPQVLHRTKQKLYEALTELLQRDFNAGEKYLDEYKKLLEIEIPADASDVGRQGLEAEQRKRQAVYFSLLARGREQQGRLTDALDAYLEYAALARSEDLISLPGEPAVKVRAEVWIQGRISALLSKAKPDERKPLEARIAEKYRAVKEKRDADGLRRFVAVFGSLSAAGKEARLQLAELLTGEAGGFLEAEQHLLILRREKDDPQLAGRAVEMLARLMTRKGMLDDAAHYYTILGREFAKVVIRDGKTGADIYNELVTDKRFLPYLVEPVQPWTGKIKVKEEREVRGPAPQIFSFQPIGERVPFFEKHRVAMHLNYHELKLIDRNTNEERWRHRLTQTNFLNLIQSVDPSKLTVDHSFHNLGHLVVLPVGHMVFGIDPVNRQLLWEKSLFGSAGAPPNVSVVLDPQDGTMRIVNPDGTVQKVGQAALIDLAAVCLLTRDGLTAIDPLTGKMLWARSDGPLQSLVFGDDRHVLLVETNAEGKATSVKAFRTSDGSSVPIPDSSRLFPHRLRIIGTHLLLSETDARDVVTMRRHDLLTGKDVWKKEFPAKTIVLRSEDPELAGVIDAEGKLTVLDVTDGKEVLKAAVKPADMERAQSVHLLRDALNYYILINRPADPNLTPGGVKSNMTPGSGIRTVPVNGEVYAIRPNGDISWTNPVPLQMLILDHFQELPILLFTSRYRKVLGPGAEQQVVAVKSIDKLRGKLVYDPVEIREGTQFHTLNIDRKAGRIELIGDNLKITHFLTKE